MKRSKARLESEGDSCCSEEKKERTVIYCMAEAGFRGFFFFFLLFIWHGLRDELP